MEVKSFLKCKWVAHSFIAGVLVLLLLFASLPGCAPAAEEEIPPAEEEAPPAEEVGPYEEYVSSLPEGCEPVPRECFEQAQREGQLNIYDWAEWWPEEIYTNFEKEFGIEIVRDNFADFDEMLAKFKLNPETEYDYVLPDIRTFAQMQDLGLLQKLNHDWVPNVNKYLPEVTKGAWYDPGYQYGAASDIIPTAYSYNTKYVDDPRIPSWAVLFEPDEKYKGRISMINGMYEVVGCALKYLGYSINSDDEGELMEVKELLLRQKPYVATYDSWPARSLREEEIWLAHQWYGDALFLNRDVETLVPALPAEGSKAGVDTMIIPIGAKHPAAAHLWVNYLYRPRVNALMIETICYLPNHTAAGEFLSLELREWLPPEEYWEICEYISPKAYTGKGLELRTEIWEELKR